MDESELYGYGYAQLVELRDTITQELERRDAEEAALPELGDPDEPAWR
jgi:hypothetical protein